MSEGNVERRNPLDLQDELTRRVGRKVRLVLTDNRSSMVSSRSRGGLLEVRLQRMFLYASEQVLDEVVGVVTSGRRGSTSRAALRSFIDNRVSELRTAAPAAKRTVSPDRLRSSYHPITEYAQYLNETYLGNRSTAEVVWGRRNSVRSSRSIRFAAYDPVRNRITMNRKMDRPDIPRYFIEFVLFHEMLHEVLGIGERPDGRRDIHGSLFQLMESTFPDAQRAREFEQELCKRLGYL
ncbi:MAG: hypothetical protein LIP23_01295 [Planctomycetes bacterium]|nr:hypothetical protein [Planctomycetota bacterium]